MPKKGGKGKSSSDGLWIASRNGNGLPLCRTIEEVDQLVKNLCSDIERGLINCTDRWNRVVVRVC